MKFPLTYPQWKYLQSLLALIFIAYLWCAPADALNLRWWFLGLLYLHIALLLPVIGASLLRPANQLTLARAFGTLPLVFLFEAAKVPLRYSWLQLFCWCVPTWPTDT